MDDTNQLKDMSLEELEKLKVKYIETYKYKKAKQIDEEIKKQRNRKLQKLNQTSIQAINSDIDKLYNEYKEIQKNTEVTYKKKELEKREEISDQFQDIQTRHIGELVKIEKEFALAVIREQKRPIPEVNAILEQSKKVAYNDDFQCADRLRKKASRIRDEQLAARRSVVDLQYNEIRIKALNKQRTEIDILKNKLYNSIENIDAQFRNESISNERAFKNLLIAYQQKVIAETTSTIKGKQEKLLVADQLNRHFFKKIKSLQLFTTNNPK